MGRVLVNRRKPGCPQRWDGGDWYDRSFYSGAVATSDPSLETLSPRRIRPGSKGETTRAAIVDAALALAAHKGVEGLSIGAVAELAGMSKSGVFAHFGSREELQIAVVRAYHERFRQEVFEPAMREPRGLARLRGLFERWLRRISHEMESGCLYISSAVEFDDQPGPVRDAVEAMVRAWHEALERAIHQAVALQQLRADTDCAQVLYELHGLILALHHDTRFLRSTTAPERARKGFERLIAAHRPTATSS